MELHEKCAVLGIYAPDLNPAYLTYLGLSSLQHRGVRKVPELQYLMGKGF